jgi:hypothetical protein
VSTRLGCVDQQRSEALHPPKDRHVIHIDAAFGQQFLHVAVGQLLAQVPTHRHYDHHWRKPEPSETGLRRKHRPLATTHRPILPEHVIGQATVLDDLRKRRPTPNPVRNHSEARILYRSSSQVVIEVSLASDQGHTIGVDHDVFTGRCSPSFLWLLFWLAGRRRKSRCRSCG